MISQVAEPVTVRLSGDDGGWRASVLGQKKNFEKYFSTFFFLKIFFACNLNLHNLYTHDDSLGFEDCRLATHLLNLF